jgi:hypothetical protein
MPVTHRPPVGLINHTEDIMCTDTATEIINFAAAQNALNMIAELPVTATDRDAMIRDLAAYGPAVDNR